MLELWGVKWYHQTTTAKNIRVQMVPTTGARGSGWYQIGSIGLIDPHSGRMYFWGLKCLLTVRECTVSLGSERSSDDWRMYHRGRKSLLTVGGCIIGSEGSLYSGKMYHWALKSLLAVVRCIIGVWRVPSQWEDVLFGLKGLLTVGGCIIGVWMVS